MSADTGIGELLPPTFVPEPASGQHESAEAGGRGEGAKHPMSLLTLTGILACRVLRPYGR